jgi:branched-chain amino acid aminotransferase
MNSLHKIWLNGKFVNWKDAKIHVLTHGLHYGTAIFEGMRCYETDRGPAIFRMKDHYERFLHGIKAYQFKLKYSLSQLCKITKELVKKNKIRSCYLRPICYVGYRGIGINIQDAPFELAIIPVDFGKYFGKKAERGISCGISSWKRISSTILSPHVKASANYLNSVLAKREAIDEGYDEAIMLSEDGHVSEGSGENIFIVDKGELITPPLYDGVLAGVTRQTIMEMAKEMSIQVRERSILRDDLYTADEVFLCGTAAEITPVKSVDKRKITNGAGPVTKELRQTFFDIVHGKDERFVKWLDFVKEKD